MALLNSLYEQAQSHNVSPRTNSRLPSTVRITSHQSSNHNDPKSTITDSAAIQAQDRNNLKKTSMQFVVAT